MGANMKMLKRIGVCLLAAVMLISTPITALADYVTGNDSYRLPVPKAYNSVKSIISENLKENRFILKTRRICS